MKNVIVSLRVYRGALSYDASGNVTSENQIVKLRHDTQEYYNFLKNLRINGYHKVLVEKAVHMSSDGDVVLEDISKYSKEVTNAFEPTATPKTATEIELEQIKAEMAELKEFISRGKQPAKKYETPEVNEELEAARVKYKELYGKDAHHMTQLKKLNKMIEAKASE